MAKMVVTRKLVLGEITQSKTHSQQTTQALAQLDSSLLPHLGQEAQHAPAFPELASFVSV